MGSCSKTKKTYYSKFEALLHLFIISSSRSRKSCWKTEKSIYLCKYCNGCHLTRKELSAMKKMKTLVFSLICLVIPVLADACGTIASSTSFNFPSVRSGGSYYNQTIAITSYEGQVVFQVTKNEPTLDNDECANWDNDVMNITCLDAGGFVLEVTLTRIPGTSYLELTSYAILPSLIEEAISDMKSYNVYEPHGTKSFDWRFHPVVKDCPSGYHYLTGWGQLYRISHWYLDYLETLTVEKVEIPTVDNAPNTRVEIKDFETYYLDSVTLQWTRVQTNTPIAGKYYREDMQGDEQWTSDNIHDEEGTVSVTVPAGKGYCYHYWLTDRSEYLSNVLGVFCVAKARLVLANSDGEDDRERAEYIMSLGAGWWSTPSGKGNTEDRGIGLFKKVTPYWQTFTFTDVSAKILRNNPPK